MSNAKKLTVMNIRQGFINLQLEEARRVLRSAEHGDAAKLADATATAARALKDADNEVMRAGYLVGMAVAIGAMTKELGTNPHRLVHGYRERVCEHIARLGE